MKRKLNPEHWNDLVNVITLAEAVRRYKIDRKTISIAIDTQKIAAIRVGRSVLISVRSMDAWYYHL